MVCMYVCLSVCMYVRMYVCVCSLFLSPAPSKHVVLSRTRRNFAAWLVGPWTRLQPSADAPRPPHSPADWLSRKKCRKFTDHQGLAIAFSHILEHTTQKLQNDQNVIKKPHQYATSKPAQETPILGAYLPRQNLPGQPGGSVCKWSTPRSPQDLAVHCFQRPWHVQTAAPVHWAIEH